MQKNIDAFWRLHPSIRKYQGGEIDPDFKTLLASMLNRDVASRPESIDEIMTHAYFTKESELIDPVQNQWTNKEALFAEFSARLKEKLGTSQMQED